MNVLLKDKMSTNKSQSQTAKHAMELAKTKIEDAMEHNASIQKMKLDEVAKLESKAIETSEFIDAEEELLDELDESIEQVLASISDKGSMLKNIEQSKTLQADLKTKLNAHQKAIHFYQHNDNCPTCKQGIEHDFKESAIATNDEKKNTLSDAMDALSSKLDSFMFRLKEIEAAEGRVQELTTRRAEHRANIKIAKSTIEGIRSDLANAKKEAQDVDEAKIKSLKSELRSLMEEFKRLSDDRETLSVVALMLKDGGIKTKIINQYVPIMNKLINKYLAAMDFFVEFQLDNNFNEKILSRHRDEFSYSSFSEGEKLRLDLAMILTWRAVSRLRNSVSTNLLIMDEVLDGSLDHTGTDDFLKLINDLTVDSNVFIISHKGDSLLDKFDHTLRFEKVKNFSRLVEDQS